MFGSGNYQHKLSFHIRSCYFRYATHLMFRALSVTLQAVKDPKWVDSLNTSEHSWTLLNTYIVSPADLVHPRIGLDVTFEVHIDSFSYRTGI